MQSRRPFWPPGPATAASGLIGLPMNVQFLPQLRSVGASKRILVVDDDEVARQAIAALLSRDYDVITAADGIDGLDAAMRERPDLIIADVWMPGVDGVLMVQRIKRIEALRHIPVIFLTGQTAVRSVVAAISAGARAHLCKPIDPPLLLRKVRSALSARDAGPAATDPSRRRK
jgi:CheY-like chemotaxis protein